MVDEESSSRVAAPLGRKRDLSRGPDILRAALDILVEVGYDGMTMDMVAGRAGAGKATVYRRWPSKGALIVEAVGQLPDTDIDSDRLPDTGTLRGDLMSLVNPDWLGSSERRLRVMAGLMSMLPRVPELAHAVDASIVTPFAAANAIFLSRAIERGEIAANTDVQVFARIIPAMAAYRLLFMNEAVSRDFLQTLIDDVVLAAVLPRRAPTNPPAELSS